ncbi:MAG: mannose-6-phosphate isomerase, class I [Melioribacteraceae bacterium]|nr:mannose-6-phosphate isomerase, class I [Melioribacteraceae bacterium]MCF8356335.1 mannose-6-phosphate isomerase, class I [Melioribacteraceae bacterium]MCF8395744.1 mannose-6-phosphate isomerase, class I [Melioribacteraceae bacterium]MCF8420546.1 mannose-6-phosphate isomerase, class I [Melioribacteraceae bacterium]
MIDKIEKRPYKLINKIQNYAWGTKNENAFIPHFIGIEPEPDVPYAELWIGAHPKAPSEIVIENEKHDLDFVISKFPEEILGKAVAERYNNKLPFLLKVLSINSALSIQTHPDKNLAEVLHRNDPENYPDDNHKPEIAIAIDSLEAIVGIKPFDEFKSAVKNYKELHPMIGSDLLNEINQLNKSTEDVTKKVYSKIMNADFETLQKVILKLKSRFEESEKLTDAEKQFLIQFDNYGIDVGLISLLLFNYVRINSGEAFFTEAGIPHAYIKGNIIECMANSDNVIRAGLTKKYKDIQTLLAMVNYNSSSSEIIAAPPNDRFVYKTPADEFEITRIYGADKIFSVDSNKSTKVVLVMDGEIEIKWTDESAMHSANYTRGEVILFPAILTNFSIRIINSGSCYVVGIPGV